jgi:DNA-binding transcriptional LysR family regulator
MIDHLRDLAIFCGVAEAGSFRAGAKKLNLSPSVVSQRVSRLEERLGTALFYRSTRKISLTDDGAELLAASKKMMAAANDGFDAVLRRNNQAADRLRLAVTGNLWEKPPFVDHLISFAKQNPKVDLSISFSDQKVELIGSEFDAALRVGWLEDSNYKARKLMEIERVLIAAPDYVSDRALPRSITDLADWDWVKLAQLPVMKQLTGKDGAAPSFTPKIAIEVDSIVAMCQMVKSGMGIAAVPRHMVLDDLHDGSLIALSLNWELMTPGVYAVWPNNVAPESLVLRFVRFMAERTTSLH